MEKIPIMNHQEVFASLQARSAKHFANYLAMYSSWYGGIIKDPFLMMLPIDDHMVHRGDGVFEALKVTHGGVYLLSEHLDRLIASGRRIGLKPSFEKIDLTRIVLQTCAAAGVGPLQSEPGILRIFLGRGVGSFSPNPYDPLKSELYVIYTKAVFPTEKQINEGMTLCKSTVPMKPGFFPQVKSLNYLPNVLMKKEAVDRKFDFAVGVDEKGNLLEGPTENLVILNKTNELCHPPLDKILKGTTMMRLFDLVERKKLVKTRRDKVLTEKDLLNARGVFMVGTSLDVVPIKQYEGKRLEISPLTSAFRELLLTDQQSRSKKLAPI